ncbi:hypothetical protein ACG5V6_20330 [Streptomyces chitinivorans]|uniref:Aminodeoxyfutalosine deaminase/Imidazolonepropionase-like composite domain-containing protein n=1 Tax=Streptomyces chitinivorans TaxID=1257027 RepID=A0ABW7HXF6_9ACTN|nr:hypothetical protein [Streptomyces chitinivorans]MDH2410436.1 hypothetical protein [Streptomyces chitinivorans]
MDTLVSAGRVLLGPRGRHITDAAVLVRGDVIADVGPRAEAEARAPREVSRFNCPGGTLLPGLIDAHVRLVLDAGPDRRREMLAPGRVAECTVTHGWVAPPGERPDVTRPRPVRRDPGRPVPGDRSIAYSS